jgi:hypothetical protein
MGYLSEMKKLTAHHLQLIWNASLGQCEAELVDELHRLLAHLLQHASSHDATQLVDTVRQCLAKGMRSEVFAFAQKLAQQKAMHGLSLEEPALDALLKLYWDVARQLVPPRALGSPQASQSQQVQMRDAVHATLRSLLQDSQATGRHVEFLSEGLQMLATSARSGGAMRGADEDELNQTLSLISLVLDCFHHPVQAKEAVTALCEQNDCAQLLLDEVSAWYQRSCTPTSGETFPSS